MVIVYYKAALGKSLDDFIENIDVRWFSGHDLEANQHRNHTHLDIGYDSRSELAVLSYEGSSHGNELVFIGNYDRIKSLKAFMEEQTNGKLIETFRA